MADRAGKKDTGRKAGKSAGHKLSKSSPAVSHAELERTFNSISMAVMLLGSDYSIKWANKATSTLLKLPLSKITGKYCHKLVHGTDEPPENCVFARMIKSRKREESEIYLEQIGIWAQGSADPEYDNKGNLKSVVHIINDITERRQAVLALKDSEARYRLLAEHMTDTIRLMDMDLKTTYLIPSAEKQRGFTYREMVEMPLEKQITPESLRAAYARLSEELPRVLADPVYNPVPILDLEYYCKDGTTVWAES